MQSREHYSLYKIPVGKTFMEGLKCFIPPREFPNPVWNLNIVLTRLMGPLFESMHSYLLHFLSWKVDFLVAITFLKCISELQALTLQEQVHNDKVVLRTSPKFLPKVVYLLYLNQTIKLPVFLPRLGSLKSTPHT